MKNLEKDSNSEIIQNKSKFVIDILDYVIKKKVDESTKRRLLTLISNEISSNNTEIQKIWKEIYKLNDFSKDFILTYKNNKSEDLKIRYINTLDTINLKQNNKDREKISLPANNFTQIKYDENNDYSQIENIEQEKEEYIGIEDLDKDNKNNLLEDLDQDEDDNFLEEESGQDEDDIFLGEDLDQDEDDNFLGEDLDHDDEDSFLEEDSNQDQHDNFLEEDLEQDEDNNNITGRVNSEEKQSIINYQEGVSKTQSEVNKIIPTLHNPKELISLLKKFSNNDSSLKYTTHSWDAGRDLIMFKSLTEFLGIALVQYNSFSFELKKLSNKLNGKIYHFLFDANISSSGWGSNDSKKRIYFGWSSPELHEACRLDAALNPEDFILPSKYQLQIAGKTIQKFKHVIDIFKNEIEIRDENSGLLNLILQKHNKFLISFADPIINNLENKTFYTDVITLGNALDMIFENIQYRPQHSQVSYNLNDEREDAYVLEILQIGSFNTGKSFKDEKLQLAKGNFGDIFKNLKNLCDWSIESNFKEGYYRINYLTSDNTTLPYQKIGQVDGFKHILTFYK